MGLMACANCGHDIFFDHHAGPCLHVDCALLCEAFTTNLPIEEVFRKMQEFQRTYADNREDHDVAKKAKRSYYILHQILEDIGAFSVAEATQRPTRPVPGM